MTGVNEFKLPDVGEGLTEAEIVAWRVKAGDVVAINDVIVEIETAKSIVELPSPYAGEVLALLAAEGQMVEVGTSIIRIGDKAAAPGPGPEVIDTNIPPTGNVTLVGYGPRQRSLKRRARVSTADTAVTPVTPVVEEVAQQSEGGRGGRAGDRLETPSRNPSSARALAKPLVRRLARDLGVDLAALRPTGPKGTITKDDVLAATGAGAPSGERETREPIKGVRKQMASAMVASAFTAPQVTAWTTIDATATVELVAKLKDRPEFKGLKVSPLLVVARACVLALRRMPLVNSTWDEAAQEVVVKHYVNLGIAAATPRGLVVPNIKDAHALSLVELAQELEALTTTAREGRTQPAQLAGGSFTITNIGVFGVDGGTPIINPGESAILCLGAIKTQPWVVDGQVVPRQVMTVTMSFDHRHVDGATGSQFLADVAGFISDPALALITD
ncbi:MAG: dihydrolipoamide acetyltransferase family protein [Propionibacteriales bacterium]|nr:dihydrolipoamide acetyltransferase family protein [Propionibacteriales bacterium]